MTKQTLTQFLFSQKGRIPRYLFWRYILFSTLSVMLYYLTLGQVNHLGILSGLSVIYLLYAYIIFLWIPNIMISIKRLHDLNQSEWLVLLYFVPYINILFFLYLGIIKGTEGNNKYGPDPLRNKMSDANIKENPQINNINIPPSTNIPPPIKSSFSPLDRARKK